MPLTPIQIKDKLTKALDGDKNQVVDEKAVEEVITLLETSTITKEILEQTRLGRDINLVRKICKNPVLAKRAKNLVKAWKKLIVVPGSPQVANGQHPKTSPRLPAVSNKCLPSPALLQVRQQQQGVKVANSSSPNVQSKVSHAPNIAPSKVDVKSRMVRSPGAEESASINCHEDSNLSWPASPPCEDRLFGDRENLDTRTWTSKPEFYFDKKSSDSCGELSPRQANRPSDQRDISKTNVANRKRTRLTVSPDSALQHPACKQPHRVSSSSSSLSALSKNDVINGSVIRKTGSRWPCVSPATSLLLTNSQQVQPEDSSLPNRINMRTAIVRHDLADSHLPEPRGLREKLSKVKTTEQLIEDMQRKSASPVGTSVIAQIRTNQIEKEYDSQKTELPGGGRERRRRRKQELELPEQRSDVGRLAQAKNEYIERFLQTSVAPTPGLDVFETHMSHLIQEPLEEQPPLNLAGCAGTFAQSAYETSFQSYSSRQDKPDSGPSASPPEARDILEATGHVPSTVTSAAEDGGAPAMLEHMSEDQLMARLPPVDFDNIDWTSQDYPPPQPVQVSDVLLDRLHNGNLEGINGTYDCDGQFRRWNEMLTVDSVFDEQLYILPYVILDD